MSKKMGKVWDASPHTIAKIAMLGRYLFVWFSMLGRSFKGKDLWYIDGFAGPGEYKNFEGSSPLSAIEAATEAISQNSNWQGGRIFCVFIEEDKSRFDHLSNVIDALDFDERIVVQLYNGTFADGIEWLKKQPNNPFSLNTPLFSFIDPFGTKGLRFEVIRELLSKPASEVLINFDSDGVSRVLKAGKDANHEENLDAMFGNKRWVDKLNPSHGMTELSRIATRFYLECLLDIPKVNYVFPFEMTSKKGLVNYHLVFASQHPKGLEKMKESMKKIDQSGEYTFCDAHVGQHNLFLPDNLDTYARKLATKFSGKKPAMTEIERFVLNSTPYLNSKAMLKHLEDLGEINVESENKARRKGTFPEGYAVTISFRETSQ